MEELFENKTKYSEKLYNIFVQAYREENAAYERGYIIFNLSFFGLCMIFAFIEKEILLGVAIFVGLLIYLWFKIIRPAIREQKQRKSPMLSGNYVNTYKFYKNYFDVENPDGKARIMYMKIFRMVETKEYYYIYLSREYAFIISKIGFTKGNNLDFATFMKKKLFTKYKNRIKNK